MIRDLMVLTLFELSALTGAQAGPTVPGRPVLPPAPIESRVIPQMPTTASSPSMLFIGSSSIGLWDLPGSFPTASVVNRGINGARIPDVVRNYTVPREGTGSVLLYLGENDIAAGDDPQAVASAILTLIGTIRRDLPRARIVYLSLKPSPSRWNLWPRMASVNARIEARAKEGGGFDYLNVGTALLGANGQPDPQYFTRDGLHMNPRGYARWTTLIDNHLTPSPRIGRASATGEQAIR